ncbi:MAG: hypothetical protein M3Q29_19855 [Chloroflexota bacterium]|nr:hypothetical protein [Chloroflexota bacterium]
MTTRILVANEPRSYREVLAVAFEGLRPDTTVVCVEPDALDGEVERLDPHVVICSRLAEVAHARPLAWVALYPDGESRSIISIKGRERVTSDDVQLGCLLAVIDQVNLLIPAPRQD